MNIISIIVVSIVLFLAAYWFYGHYLSRFLKLNDDTPTPAHTHRDNIDYMPGKMAVVLGHHFASIAGAGPIVGPIIAVAFGWIPALIWIIIGGIFFGAVHDLGSMIASIRHSGRSIGDVIDRYIGTAGRVLFMIFAFSTLILLIAVFMDIVAKTFVSVPSAASASVMFMGLALVFGFVSQKVPLPLWLLTVVGVSVMYLMVYAGMVWPLDLSYGSWVIILFGYCLAAAVAPVWLLLQPRDYLNSFLLYGMMLLGIISIFVANPEIRMDTQVHLKVDNLGYLFPVLFVTIACGAISGFHSVVASGTTSKQIARETDARRVGFGGMLIESLLAVIAVCTVIILSREEYFANLRAAGPVALYSQGLGGFISSLGIPVEWAVSFVALTVSAFAVTTLDTCTRLARFIFQESFQSHRGKVHRVFATNRYLSTFIVAVCSVSLLWTGQFDELWPIFGSANTLLAALALLAVTVWLYKTGSKPYVTLIPMVFMFLVAICSLLLFALNKFGDRQYILAAVAAVLFGIALVLIYLARVSLKEN